MPPSGTSLSKGTTVVSTKHHGSTTSLPSRIHSATRDYHTVLNRLITARLPLCLPPCTDSPFLYLFGLRRFARLYFAFEDALDSLAREDGRESKNKELPDASVEITPQTRPDLKAALRSLQLPQLARNKRLRNDISFLQYSLSAGKPHMGILKDEGEQAQAFAAHIRQTASDKPHALLAYTWVMYMALFNGGRWMRSQFLNAGELFWTGHHLSDYKNMKGSAFASHTQRLSFWSFDDRVKDGEDIKEDFRARFLTISELLTKEERDEVVQEAVVIFQRLTLMVEELDSDGKKIAGLVDNKPSGRALPLVGVVQYVHRLWTSRWSAWDFSPQVIGDFSWLGLGNGKAGSRVAISDTN